MSRGRGVANLDGVLKFVCQTLLRKGGFSGIPWTVTTTPERYAFFQLYTISIRYLAFLFDMIRYCGLRKDLLLRNFSEFSEFLENFLNFQRIFGKIGQKNWLKLHELWRKILLRPGGGRILTEPM